MAECVRMEERLGSEGERYGREGVKEEKECVRKRKFLCVTAYTLCSVLPSKQQWVATAQNSDKCTGVKSYGRVHACQRGSYVHDKQAKERLQDCLGEYRR